MSCFLRFFLAVGLLQSAFASPTLKHVPAHKAAQLQERQLSKSYQFLSAILTAIEDTAATPTDIPAATSDQSTSSPSLSVARFSPVTSLASTSSTLGASVSAVISGSMSISVLPTPVIRIRNTTVLECDGAQCSSTAHKASTAPESEPTHVSTTTKVFTVTATTGRPSTTVLSTSSTPMTQSTNTTILECDGAKCSSTAHKASTAPESTTTKISTVLECDKAKCSSTAHKASTAPESEPTHISTTTKVSTVTATTASATTIYSTVTKSSSSTAAISKIESDDYTVTKTLTVPACSTKTSKSGGCSTKNAAPWKPDPAMPSWSKSGASSSSTPSAPATTAEPEDVYSSTGDRVLPDGSYDLGDHDAKPSSGSR